MLAILWEGGREKRRDMEGKRRRDKKISYKREEGGYTTRIMANKTTGSNITAVYRCWYTLRSEEMHAKPTPAPVAEDRIFDVEIRETTELGKEKYLKGIKKKDPLRSEQIKKKNPKKSTPR
jgi:hypothetical protein